jgi:hypothetical protein
MAACGKRECQYAKLTVSFVTHTKRISAQEQQYLLVGNTGRGIKLLVGNVQNCRAISPGIPQAAELFLGQLLLL